MEEAALEAVVRGLTDRVRTLVLALDRQDRLETAGEFVGWLGDQTAAGRLPEVTQELLLRALRVASDPINLGILTRLDPLAATGVADLVRQTGLTRVAVSERVNDLSQAGLATREMIGDEVRSTPLAGGLIELLADVSERSAELLARQLAEGRRVPDAAADGPAPEPSLATEGPAGERPSVDRPSADEPVAESSAAGAAPHAAESLAAESPLVDEAAESAEEEEQ